MSKEIAFIVEPSVIEGRSYLPVSGDLAFIFQALSEGFQVYLISTDDFASQIQQGVDKLKMIELSALNQELKNLMKDARYLEVLRGIFGLASVEDEKIKKRSFELMFENSKEKQVEVKDLLIWNRAEPQSLDEKFYDYLIKLKNDFGATFVANPELIKSFGDKRLIKAIHSDEGVLDGINYLENVTYKNGENKISFDTEIVQILPEEFDSQKTVEFFSRINHLKSEEDIRNFSPEFDKAILKIKDFHNNILDGVSCLKPEDFFGGSGIEFRNKKLSYLEVVDVVCDIYEKVKADCIQGGYEQKATLSSIIVQEQSNNANLGDFRIICSKGEILGMFIRVNPKFDEVKANNLHHGGHPEFFMIDFDSNVDEMFSGLDQNDVFYEKNLAIRNLLKSVEFINKIPVCKEQIFNGIDALYHRKNGILGAYINEMNLTCPMGAAQVMIGNYIFALRDEIFEIILKHTNIEPTKNKFSSPLDVLRELGFENDQDLFNKICEDKNLRKKYDEKYPEMERNSVLTKVFRAFK